MTKKDQIRRRKEQRNARKLNDIWVRCNEGSGDEDTAESWKTRSIIARRRKRAKR